jgi:hypothetical protein
MSFGKLGLLSATMVLAGSMGMASAQSTMSPPNAAPGAASAAPGSLAV